MANESAPKTDLTSDTDQKASLTLAEALANALCDPGLDLDDVLVVLSSKDGDDPMIASLD